MHGFVTLSSLFIASMVLVMVSFAEGNTGDALWPLAGAFVSGCAVVRMVALPRRRRNKFDE